MPYHRLAREESRTSLCSILDYCTKVFVLYTLIYGSILMSLMSEIPKSESRYFYSSPLPCCGRGLALTLMGAPEEQCKGWWEVEERVIKASTPLAGWMFWGQTGC